MIERVRCEFSRANTLALVEFVFLLLGVTIVLGVAIFSVVVSSNL